MKRARSEEGQVFLLTVLFLLLLALLAVGGFGLLFFNARRTRVAQEEIQALYAATGQVEACLGSLLASGTRCRSVDSSLLSHLPPEVRISPPTWKVEGQTLWLTVTATDAGFRRTLNVGLRTGGGLFRHAAATGSGLTIPKGAQITGNVAADGSVRVRGQVYGSIAATGQIIPSQVCQKVSCTRFSGFSFPPAPLGQSSFWRSTAPSLGPVVQGDHKERQLSRLPAGTVAFVKGDLRLRRPLPVPLVLLVDGSVTLSASPTPSGAAQDTVIVARKDIRLKDRVTARAFLLSLKKITLHEGTALLGSAVASSLKLAGGSHGARLLQQGSPLPLPAPLRHLSGGFTVVSWSES